MKSFQEIIKMSVVGTTRRGVVDNRDLLKFIADLGSFSRESLEKLVENSLISAGFTKGVPITSFVSPSQHATIYEQPVGENDVDTIDQ